MMDLVRNSAPADGAVQAPMPLRVLVVEDEAVIAVLLAEVLEGMGHEVCAIESSEATAVLAAARQRPDLMIVDVTLRAGSGVSAVAQIIRHRFVPHVFVTGRRLAAEGLDPGAVVLQKPFDEDELEQAIRRALLQAVGRVPTGTDADTPPRAVAPN